MNYDEGCMWAIPCNFPFLFCYDFATNAIVKTSVLPHKYLHSKRAFSKIIRNGENLYLVPNITNELVKYNLSTNRYSSIDLSGYILGDKGAFYGILPTDDSLYITSSINGVLRIDFKDDSISRINNDLIMPNFTYDQNIITASDAHNNRIVQYNTNFQLASEYTIGETNERFFAPIEYGEDVYAMCCIDNTNMIMKYNKVTGNVERFKLGEYITDYLFCPSYIGSFTNGKEIVFLPSNCGEDIVAIDILTNAICRKTYANKEKYAFSTFLNYKSYYCFFEVNDGKLYIVDKATEQISAKDIALGEEYDRWVRIIKNSDKSYFDETKSVDLAAYIDILELYH